MATTREILDANGQILRVVVIPNAAGTSGDAQLVGLVDVNGTVLTPAQDSTLATHFGADGTGITPPTGGSGTRGWLSGVYKTLNGALSSAGALFVNGRLLTSSDIVTAVPRAPVVLLDTTTVTAQTATYLGPDISCSGYTWVWADVNVTALTAAGATFAVLLQRKARDGSYVSLAQLPAISAVGTVALDAGPGTGNASNAVSHLPGDTVRLALSISGGTTPSVSFAYSVKGL